MQKAYFDSPIGVLEICGDESGVCELNFVREFICAEVTDANLKDRKRDGFFHAIRKTRKRARGLRRAAATAKRGANEKSLRAFKA